MTDLLKVLKFSKSTAQEEEWHKVNNKSKKTVFLMELSIRTTIV